MGAAAPAFGVPRQQLKPQAFSRPRLVAVEVDRLEAECDASSYVADRRQVELFPDTLPQADLFGADPVGELLHDSPLVAVKPESAVESFATSAPLSARSFRSAEGAKISPRGGREDSNRRRGGVISNSPTSGAALTLVVTESVQTAYDGRKSAIKELAADAGCTPHTAKNWWQAKNLPDLVNAVNLAKEAPGIAVTLVEQLASHKNVFALLGELHRLARMEAGQDPMFAIEYQAFVQKHLLAVSR